MGSRTMRLVLGAAAAFTVVVPMEVAAASPAPVTAVESVQPRALAGAPRSVSAVPLDRAARVRWRAPSNTGGETITGYRVQRRTPSGWRTVADVGASKRRTTVDGLVNGRSYRFRVAARNASGVGRFSDPVTVTLPVVKDLRAGFFFSCALLVRDSTVGCWGDNTNGELGQGDTDAHVGVQVAQGLSGVRSIAVGEKHVCAVRTGRTLWCWGDNDFAQLGNGSEDTDVLTPTAVDLEDVIGVGAGQTHTCALTADRTVWCWGNNAGGQVGQDPATDSQVFTPTQVPGLSDVRSLVMGHFFSCAVLLDRTMTCWGQNGSGQLGDGSQVQSHTPVAVVGVSDVRSASAGAEFVCAVTRTDEVSCWGGNDNGQIGDGTTLGPRLAATPVTGVSDVVRVSTGRDHACAVLRDRSLRCWGDNTFGEIGDGTTEDRPTAVTVATGRGVTIIGTGNDHTCAALANARVKCWGFNLFGALGDQTTTDSPVPVLVRGL